MKQKELTCTKINNPKDTEPYHQRLNHSSIGPQTHSKLDYRIYPLSQPSGDAAGSQPPKRKYIELVEPILININR